MAINLVVPVKLLTPTLEQAKSKTYLANALVNLGVGYTQESANSKIEYCQDWVNKQIKNGVTLEYLEQEVARGFFNTKLYLAAFLPERIHIHPETQKISTAEE